MQDFKKLNVWGKAHLLTIAIYKCTVPFPDTERYGLVCQMRRSAASIPTNIAEGCGRNGGKELIRFLHIASGSAHELEYQLILSKDLGLLREDEFDRLNQDVLEIQRMLAGLQRTIQASV